MLIGLVSVGFGIYVRFAEADAVGTLIQMQTEVGKAANAAAGKEGAEQARNDGESSPDSNHFAQRASKPVKKVKKGKNRMGTRLFRHYV